MTESKTAIYDDKSTTKTTLFEQPVSLYFINYLSEKWWKAWDDRENVLFAEL